MAVTINRAQLIELYPRAKPALIDGFLASAGDVLPRFGLDANIDRLSYFLAQVGHESGGLSITAENLNYSAKRMTEVWPKRFPTIAAAEPFANNAEKLANFVYGGRMGNGPAASGDGFRFRGRGYIQITGRDGYANVAAKTGLPLETQPQLAAEAGTALLAAAGFWAWKKLNPVCDAQDFVGCTKLINGGTIGLPDRRAWLDKARRALMPPPPKSAQPAAAVVIRVQQELRANGFTDIGAADGLVGPRTKAAIDTWRMRNGLPAGLIDDSLLASLGISA